MPTVYPLDLDSTAGSESPSRNPLRAFETPEKPVCRVLRVWVDR